MKREMIEDLISGISQEQIDWFVEEEKQLQKERKSRQQKLAIQIALMAATAIALLVGAFFFGRSTVVTAQSVDPDETKQYPEHYKQLSELLGHSREAVLTELDLTDLDLTLISRAYYNTPIQVQYCGLAFMVRLEFDEVNDRLTGFDYYAQTENEWDQTILDVVALAETLTETFGEVNQSVKLDQDAAPFSRMSPEELSEMLASKEHTSGWDSWTVGRREDPAIQEYLAVAREAFAKILGGYHYAADAYYNEALEMKVLGRADLKMLGVNLRFRLKIEFIVHGL